MAFRHREKSTVRGRSIKTMVELEHDEPSGTKVQRPCGAEALREAATLATDRDPSYLHSSNLVWSALWSQTAISKIILHHFLQTWHAPSHSPTPETWFFYFRSPIWTGLFFFVCLFVLFFSEFPVPTSWLICGKTKSVTVEWPKHHFPDLFPLGLIMSKRRRVRGKREGRGSGGTKGEVLLKVLVFCSRLFL